MYNSAFGTFVTNDMISPCWGDTIRLNYNLGLSKIATKASLCMTPIFDPSIMYEYPQFGAFGNGLLNPIMAINQTMQSFGGGWNNGWNFGNFQNWFNTNPWTTGGGGGNSSKLTDSEREELAKVKDDVEFLKGLLKEVKTTAKDDIDRDTLRKIELALTKSSSAKTELERNKEILTSLQEAYKSIDKDIIRKVTPTLVEVKGDLYESGFDFSNSDNSYEFVPDKDQVDNTSDKVIAISSAINDIRSANRTCKEVSGIQKHEVLRILSAWNDQYKADDERSIIRAVNKQIKDISAADEKKDVVTGVISPLATALMQQTSSILNNNSKNFDKSVKEAVEKQIKDLTDALNNAKDEANETNLNDLADKFEAVYLSARKISAMSAQKAVANKYSFVDKIETGTEDDVFTDELFKKATVEDLEKEGFKGDDLKFDSFKLKKANTPADPKITKEFLTDSTKNKGEVTVHKASENGFNFTVYKYKDKYYEIKDNKIKEVSNPTIINTNNNTPQNSNNQITKQKLEADGTQLTKIKITMRDGSEKEVDPAKLKSGKQYYELDEKIYSIDKDGNVKEETNVKKAE